MISNSEFSMKGFSLIYKNLAIASLSASVKYWSPSSVKLLRLRFNDFSLQLLCLSAAAKSFAALSVKLFLANCLCIC